MGVSKRICSANQVEIRELKGKTKRILEFQNNYPHMSSQRRMSLAVSLNEIMERVEYLKRDKHANDRRYPADNYAFQYVFKKNRVKNRQL